MSLALVRHGRTEWNRERRMQGRSDVELDDHGRAQADAAGRLLARAVWTDVVSSPLRRAVESASIIRAHLPGAGLGVDDALLERDYGDAEGMAVAEVHERWPDQDYPGAEPVADVARRAAEALRRLAERPGSTVVVAHGTVLRVGIESLTGRPCPRILNGEVLMLEADGRAEFRARRLGA